MQPMPDTPTETRHAQRVLVVDDERDVASSLASLLEALGHQVRYAYEGIQALLLAQEFRPDTAFVDIGLPGMDGYELGRRLRACLPQLRVVALSGDPTESGRNAAVAFFDAFILKPGSVQHIERA